MNNISKFIAIVYGILTLSGGIVGYIKSDSIISFITGAITGAVTLAAMAVYNEKAEEAYLLIASLTLILSGLFLNRFIASGYVFMPGGMMFIASITTFTIVSLSWFSNKAKK